MNSAEMSKFALQQLMAREKHKTDNRPSRIARIMISLELESLWATCARNQVASAAITNDYQMVVMARNGTPSMVKHCTATIESGQRCIWCIHSETNLINRAAKVGIKLHGLNVATLYRPCLNCANNLIEAGISGLFYRWEYDTDGQRDNVIEMLRRRSVHVERILMSEQEVSFHNMLKEWKVTWTK